MTTVKELHQQAMDIAHEAIAARDAGDTDRANQLTLRAFDLEINAARLIPDNRQSEPTRSILYRSAASLAYQAAQYDEAIRLIAVALTGYPPPKIKNDLLNLLDQVKFYEYLASTEQDLEEDGLLVTIRGRAVGAGLVLYDEFKGRYENIVSLVNKTTQRLTSRPYTRGADRRSFTFQKLIDLSVPQNSFAVTMRLTAPQNPSFLIPEPKRVIDEVVHGVDLIGEGKENELRQHINDEPYFIHFVNIVKAMAPDGDDVNHVGLASSKRSATLTRTSGEIAPPSPRQDEITPDSQPRFIERTGRLAYADDLTSGENAVAIELDDGTSMKVKLTEGIDDIVDQHWKKVVIVSGTFDGKYIYPTEINPVKR